MKKLKYFLWIIFLHTSPALAAIPGPNKTDAPETGLPALITTISNTILALVGVVAVLFLIVGGVQYITSAGNPDNVGKAKNTILYGIIGVIFAILSYAIVQFVIDKIK